MRFRLFATTVALAVAALAATAQENALTRLATDIGGRVTFSGYAMAGWELNDRAHPSNEFKINKIILMGDMRVTDDLHAFLMYDFKGGTLHEYWASYRVKPWFNVKLGQFKTPFSIENPISPSRLELITQTSLATNYMIIGSSPTMMPGSAGRDLGLTVYGTAWKGRVSYDLAVMNGEGRNKSDRNSTKDIVGRLTLRPVSEVSLSVSGVHGRGHLDDLTEAPWLKGRDSKNNFERQRLAVGATLDVSHFNARGEYMWGRDGKGDVGHSSGGYVTAAVRDIGVKGLDIVGGYDHLKPAGEPIVNRWQGGVQYWFYPRCRLQVAVTSTRQEHMSGTCLLSQLQIAF